MSLALPAPPLASPPPLNPASAPASPHEDADDGQMKNENEISRDRDNGEEVEDGDATGRKLRRFMRQPATPPSPANLAPVT
jgi:hypothetical protein